MSECLKNSMGLVNQQKYPGEVTLQETITYPTKREVRKIIDSKLPLLGEYITSLEGIHPTSCKGNLQHAFCPAVKSRPSYHTNLEILLVGFFNPKNSTKQVRHLKAKHSKSTLFQTISCSPRNTCSKRSTCLQSQ